MTSSIPTLDYAERPRWARRRKTRRAILLVLMLASIYPAWRWSRPVYRHLCVLYWERQAGRHVLPPDTVVLCTDDQTHAKSLLASKRPYLPIVDGKADAYHTGSTGAGYAPPCVMRWLPPDATARVSTMGGAPAAGDGLLFVHDLTSPAGHRRGVAVYWEHVSLNCPRWTSEWIVWEPATLLRDPRVLNREQTYNYRLDMGGPQFQYRFWAGQLDPKDPSHFTIRYRIGYAPFDERVEQGILEGWLRDDDTVELAQSHDGDSERIVIGAGGRRLRR